MDTLLTSRKQRALDYFVTHLTEQVSQESLDRILLFGSLAWGQLHRDSDIDLAIFARNPKSVEKKIDELSYEVMDKFGESVEPIIYSAKLSKHPNTYLSWLVTQKGVEIYPKKASYG